MKDIPFYSNREDNLSCFLACLRSALEYFSNKSWSWEELETLTGFQKNKTAWTVKTWTTLSQQGFDINMIEEFDYKKYYDEGESYLSTFLNPEELSWQQEHSNISEIRPFIPEFLKTVHFEQKSPTLKYIDELLDKDYLVIVQLNSSALNDDEGYISHAVLVYDSTEDEYIAHDPGNHDSGISGRHISKAKLYKAMGGNNNTVEVTGIKVGETTPSKGLTN